MRGRIVPASLAASRSKVVLPNLDILQRYAGDGTIHKFNVLLVRSVLREITASEDETLG